MSALDAILEAPESQGRYWLVVKVEDGNVGMIPLALDGSEAQKVATNRFEDACAVARQEIAKNGGWMPCNYHVDGKPRSEFEMATDSYLKKMGAVGWDNQDQAGAEFDRMVSLRPAQDDPYWAVA